MENPFRKIAEPVREPGGELSPEDRELAADTEKLPMIASEQVSLLLVAKGLKPAFLGSPNFSEEAKERIRQWAEKHDVHAVRETTMIFGEPCETLVFAKNQHTADQIMKLQKTVLEKRVPFTSPEGSDDYELGIALGFPETAVAAFREYHKAQFSYEERIRNHVYPRGPYPKQHDFLLNPETLPEHIRNSEVFRFNKFFVLSKEHWAEELQTVKTWANETKRLSPKIYKRMIGESPDPERFIQNIQAAFRRADVVALGETRHGRHAETLKNIFDRITVSGIFLEEPNDFQEAIDHSIAKGSPDGDIEKTIAGALKEGKDVRRTYQLLIDVAQEKHIPVICVDSSKRQNEEYATKSPHAHYFLKGESRDADMAANMKKYLQDHPGKYFFLGGADHVANNVSEQTKLPNISAHLVKALGKKYERFLLEVDED